MTVRGNPATIPPWPCAAGLIGTCRVGVRERHRRSGQNYVGPANFDGDAGGDLLKFVPFTPIGRVWGQCDTWQAGLRRSSRRTEVGATFTFWADPEMGAGRGGGAGISATTLAGAAQHSEQPRR